MGWVKITAVTILGAIVLGPAVAWLVCTSAFLASTRADLASQYLSSSLGQPLRIDGGLVVRLGSVLQVSARNIAVPSRTLTDGNLLEIGEMRFGIALSDLLGGDIYLRNPVADAARVRLLVDEDGQSSWLGASSAAARDANHLDPADRPSRDDTASGGFVPFGVVAGEMVQVTDFGLLYQDARNGLDLDLNFTALSLSRTDPATPFQVEAKGVLNDQPLTLRGTFSQAGPFGLNADFDQMNVRLDGNLYPDGHRVGYSGTVTAEIAELGQLLDVLKLKKNVSGTAGGRAAFRTEQGKQYVDDLTIDLALDSGPSLKLSGDLGELGNPNDANIDSSILLYAPDNLPPTTNAWRELKLIAVNMRLIARPEDIPLREMVIETNGFSLVTGGEGPPPIKISGIRRTPDGHLRLGQTAVRIGPPDAPYLVLEGSIADAMLMGGIDAAAVLEVPIGAMFAPELLQKTSALGVLSGRFNLAGDGGEMALTEFEASVQGTDLWRLDASGQISNVLQVRDVEMDISADVPSATELLSAVGIPPRNPGTFALAAAVSSQGVQWESDVKLTVGGSSISYAAVFDLNEENPVIGRRIESDLIRIEDIRSIVSAVAQIWQFNNSVPGTSQTNSHGAGRTEHGYVVQPLVLNNPDATEMSGNGPSGAAAPERARVVKPLVLQPPISSRASASELSDKGIPEHGNIVQPLVIGTPRAAKLSQPGKDRQIDVLATQNDDVFQDVTLKPLGQAIMQSNLELGITVDLRRIVGVQGATSLRSYLEIKGRQARMGPIKFAYGGGQFDVTGSMNLDSNANTLRVWGTASGWDFAELMREFEFQQRASGELSADFDVTGRTRSVRDFLKTLSGRATVSMRNGSIETQLLDLAGLGVIPWLFSKDLKKLVPLACVRAPLSISKGRIATKFATIETDLVQLVVNGHVDLDRNTLYVEGLPRRIGRPLSRSPWPFTVSGQIAAPHIEVKDSLRHQRRTDGASTMPPRRQQCVADILQLE